jgi:hypothetical protein
VIARADKAGEVSQLGKVTGRAANSKPDFVVRKADGSVGIVEAKFGTSQLTKAQRELRKQVGEDAFRISRTSYEDVRNAGGAAGSVAGSVVEGARAGAAAGRCTSSVPSLPSACSSSGP